MTRCLVLSALPAVLLSTSLLAAPQRYAGPQDLVPPGGGASSATDAQEPQAADSAADDDVQRAIKALNDGDMRTAKALVDQLLIEDRSKVATERLAEAQPRAALAAIDEALAVESIGQATHLDLLVLRGRCAFTAAANDPAEASLFEEALANFEEAARRGAGVSAAFRASRAARMIGDPARALELARAGVRWVDAKEGRSVGLDLDQPYARTWAEAAFSSYLAAEGPSGGSGGSTTIDPSKGPAGAPTGGPSTEPQVKAELYAEARTALERCIGDAPTDTWAYRELANLELWEGKGTEALTALESALSVQPADEATHTAFVRVLGDQAESGARAAGLDDAGALNARFESIIGRYGQFRETHPENALGYWYGGYEAFYRALNAFESGATDPTAFAEAGALFRGCRERSASYAESSVDYEVLCRVGQGWCAYTAENDELAIETFFSAEELRPLARAQELGLTGGLDLRLPRGDGTDRLPSALAGLDFVTRRSLTDPNDVAALTRAAGIGDRMFAARPDNANLANNAGFLNRDAAVQWELLATMQFRDASAGDAVDEKKQQTAQASRDRGQELMERSWAAYQVAARLLPDDVRVVNDAGLVMAYYLRTEQEASEAYFLDAIADGEPQLASQSLGEAEREALNEAWGDAHQNMGVLEMSTRQRPRIARAWYAKALEIGPPSRNWIGETLLPLLDDWIETGERSPALNALEAQTVWTHNPPND